MNTEHLCVFFPPKKRTFDPFLVTVASFPCGKVPSPPLTDCVALVKCLIQDLKGFPGGSVVKNWPAMQKTWVQFLGREDPLEEEMATHSRILAWRIQWTEEPGRLQSMGSVDNWATEQQSVQDRPWLSQHKPNNCVNFSEHQHGHCASISEPS